MSDCHERGQTRIRWTARPDGMEESVQFRPGYNCPVNTMQGHGVHGMELTWLLRGPAGAVQIVFGTDWIPGELRPGHGLSPDGTRGWKSPFSGRWSTDPAGRGIGVHSRTPQFEGHESEPVCGLLDAPCFYEEWLSAADQFVPLFMAQGEQVIWDAMEAKYRAVFEVRACLICNREAEFECAGCGAPLCDDDAQVRDFDRYCPGGTCLL